MSGLTREILKWVQSLDLSYSVRNVKRDFANGFLVAEIFSRYYPKDITMHSFDNGTGMSKRKDNWLQLEKFFLKIGFHVERRVIDSILHCKSDCVVAFIETIYTLLTNKTIPSTRAIKEELQMRQGNNKMPPFARPTASYLVKDRLNQPDVKHKNEDILLAKKLAQTAIADHGETLRNERVTEPQRFQPQLRSGEFVNRVASRTIDREEKRGAQVKFKSAEVKQLSSMDVLQMRAKRKQKNDMINSRGMGMNGDFDNMSGMNINNGVTGGGAAGMGGGYSVNKSVRQLLSSLIRSKLEGNPIIKRFDPRKELIISFVESLAMFPDELAADIINDFSFKIASMCVDNCLSSPKEFWVLFHLLSTALEKTDVNSRAFGATVNFLIMVGRGMVNKDTFSPFALLCDFAMPKLIQLCKRTPSKCTALAAVIYSYSSNDPDDNIHVIRVIRDALEDLPLLIRMLSTLVGLEQHFTEKLLDLYFYYIVTGLQHTTPDVRAVSISILASLAVSPVLDTGFTHVLNLWDRLAKLVDDEWQVQAQLVITAASLLGRIKRGDDSSGGDAGNNSGSNTKYASIEGVLDKLLTVDANSLVVMAGISSLPRVFPHSKYQALFLQLLYEREDVRAQLSDRQQSGDVPEIYNLPALPSLPIMEGIASDVLTQELENLSPHHVQALVTALSGFVALQPHEASRWMELLDVIKAHVAAELCDPSMSGDIVRILLHFLTDASTATAAVKIMTTGDVPPLYAVLPHIFAPDGPEVCREMMMSFLTTLVQSQPVTKQAVESLVKAFRANEPALYNGSPLEDLARTYSF